MACIFSLKMPDFHVAFRGSFTCRKSTTRDPQLYFPSEGRHPEDFSSRKIRRLRPGLNPQSRVLKASTLPLDHRSKGQHVTSRPPKPLPLRLIPTLFCHPILCLLNSLFRFDFPLKFECDSLLPCAYHMLKSFRTSFYNLINGW
jgi:hypothetical protein